LSGLICNTLYHFRASGTNGGGTNKGGDQTLTTLACTVPPTPPTVTTTSATGIGQTTGTLTGTANPNGSATQGQFQWGLTTAYGNITTLQSLGSGSTVVPFPDANLTGLICGTTYNFRATASSAGGTTNGANVAFVTAACTVPVPTVTTTSATGVGQAGVTLNGTVNPNSSLTTGQFQWGLTTAYGNTTTSQSLGSGAIAVPLGGGAITGLACNTTYNYRATATNPGGTANGSNLTVTTAACSVPPTPPTVTTTSATNVGQTTAMLTATVNPAGSATSGQFQWGLTTAYGNSTPTQALGSGIVDVALGGGQITGLICNTTYNFRATATNGGGTTNGANLTLTTANCTPVLPTVTTSTATGVGQSGATLNGTVNPNGFPTTGNFVWGTTTAYGQSTGTQAMGSGNTAVALTTGILTGLACNTTYHYRAVGTNAAGTANGSDGNFTTSACPLPPTVSTGVATSITQTTATLNGTANPNGSVTSALFQWGPTTTYGSSTPGQALGSGSSPVSVGGGAITGLLCNTTYNFRVTASSSAGTTNGANASLTTSACSPATPTYYVSTLGNDANSCASAQSTTQSNQKRTVSAGISCLAVGNILMVHGGTYDEFLLLTNMNGSSWTTGNFYKIQNYPSETVWLKKSPDGNAAGWTISLLDNDSYIWFDGINIDTSLSTLASRWGGISTDVINTAPTHIRYYNAEIIGSRIAGDLASSLIGIDWRPGGARTFHEVSNVAIHGSGGPNAFYGMYIHSSDNTFDGLDMYDLGLQCVQIYDLGAAPERNVIKNSKCHDINTSFDSRRVGILLEGNENQVINTLIYNINTDDSGTGNGVSLYTGLHNQFLNNTVYNVHGDAADIASSSTNGVISNSIFYGNFVNVPQDFGGTGTVLQTNLTGPNPLFVNAAGGNFQLSSPSSPAFNTGTTLSVVPFDFLGVPRPQCSTYDIGAYELVTCQ
jgi:hypothetical protein